MTNSVDPDQTAPIGAVFSGSTLFASILNLSSNVRQLFAADDIFRCIFFLALSGLTYEPIHMILVFISYVQSHSLHKHAQLHRGARDLKIGLSIYLPP